MRFPVPGTFFIQRAASPFGLQRHTLCYMFVHRADLGHGSPVHHQAVRQRTGRFVPCYFAQGALDRHPVDRHPVVRHPVVRHPLVRRSCLTFCINRVSGMVSRMHNWITAAQWTAS
jgi:hypothetical protein